MSQSQYKGKDVLKFAVLSFLGVFLFFIPVKGSTVPVVVMINKVKEVLGSYSVLLPVIGVSIMMITLFLGKVLKIEPFKTHHEKDSLFKVALYISTFVIVILLLLGKGPAPLRDPKIGGTILGLATTIMLTIMIAGWLVVFIIKSGLVEFVSVLVEPIMRPVFKLPGEAAVNCISSFVSSAAVGVYFTEQYYKSKAYTQREAVSVAVSFSVISVSYMAILSSIAGIEDKYGAILITSFLLILIMAAICIRIPPLSLKKQEYVDGVAQTKEDITIQKIGPKNRWNKAVGEGVKIGGQFTSKDFFKSFVDGLFFGQKIICVQITVVIVVLTLVHYTDLFTILGKPFIPIYTLLGLPNAAEIAPATLIGIVEVTLPAITVSGLSIAPQASFFVVVLSIVQVIFFTEAGNAMLGSSLPITLLDLISTFAVRTIVAIPLVALASHLIF